MSIGEKMQAISQSLESVYGAAFVRGRSKGYDAGYEKGHYDGAAEGFTAGREIAEAECRANHVSLSILGSGTRKLSIPIPFMPDTISVFSINPYSGTIADTFKSLVLDMRCYGQHMGNALYCLSHGTVASAMLAPSGVSRFVKYEDGVFSFELSEGMLPNLIWPENVRYTVIASKYSAETGLQLVTEHIALLPDTVPEGSNGELVYYQDFLLRYISLPDWEKLIATKPNWTFVLK